MTRDLTAGRPLHLIFEFAIPTMLGMLFQQLYSMVDTMIVGKLLGEDALAAVGSTGSIQFLVLGFCIGICNGFAIPVAQALGAGEHSRMRRYVTHCGYLAATFALVLTLLTCFFCNFILTSMDTPANIYDATYGYLFIIFAGIPACFLYNMPAAIVRSLGDSRTPVYFLAIASVLNIVLDVVFIITFQMGVAGAAIATIISQGAAGIISLWFMVGHFPILHTEKGEWQPDGQIAMALCGSGLPMGLQYSVTAIGSIILQTSVNRLGSGAVAAIAAGQKLNMMFYIPYDALGATMATYCGQNVGARKLDRLSRGIWSCTFIGVTYSLIIMVLLYVLAPQASLLFLDGTDLAVLAMTVQYIRISMLFAIPLALVNIIRFSIQGMGFSNFAVLAGVMEMVARAAFGLWLVPRFGFIAASLASPAAWIMADAFLIPAAIWCVATLRKRMNLPRGLEISEISSNL